MQINFAMSATQKLVSAHKILDGIQQNDALKHKQEVKLYIRVFFVFLRPELHN